MFSHFSGCCSPFIRRLANVKHLNTLVANDEHLVIFVIGIRVSNMAVLCDRRDCRESRRYSRLPIRVVGRKVQGLNFLVKLAFETSLNKQYLLEP